MVYNKEEARRAMELAEKKLSENDYVGAKKFVNKAHNLCPGLEGLNQVLMMIHVYISASNGEQGEANWYGVLGVDPLADAETVKKQYKKLALLLHPDKNKFHGAEEAFKLVLEASCLLSDKAKRVSYDQKTSKRRKSETQQKPPKPYERAPSPPIPKRKPKPQERAPSPPIPKRRPKPNPKPNPNSSSIKEKVFTFWTMCNRCKTYYEYVRENYLNKTLHCQNCGQDFVAAEVIPEYFDGRPYIRMSPSFYSTRKTTSDTSSSSTDSAKPAHRRMRRWFEPMCEPDSSSTKDKLRMFWTVCNRCKTYCRFVRTSYLNKTLPCQNCGLDFIAAEIIPKIVDGSPVIR